MSEPARWGLRRSILDGLDRIGLAKPTAQLYELALAAASRLRRGQETEAGGLPLPPTRLRAQVGPKHADSSFFLRSGVNHAELIGRMVRDSGSSLEELDALLDFGCGCGRVLRHWSGLPHTRVCGCDVNPRMVEWCNANLPFVEATVNPQAPPFSYESSTFDLVYAFSVFTHLTEEAQHAWMQECVRVLKPRGLLLISTLGEHYLSLGRLTASEREAFGRGELVVLFKGSSGSSLCSAYHPPEYVRTRLASGLELVAHLPAADDGRHDLYLFRKPG